MNVNKTVISFLATAAIYCSIHAENLMPVIPGESILETSLSKWQYKALTPHTKFTSRRYFQMHASNKLKGKASGQISCTFDNLDCSGYDQLVLYFYPRRALSTKIVLETDAGTRTGEAKAAKGKFSFETTVDLNGAKKIKKMTIVVEGDKPGRGLWANEYNFIALRNSAEYQAYNNYFKRFAAMNWSKYLNRRVNYVKPTLCLPDNSFEKFRQMCLEYPEIKAKFIAERNRLKKVLAGPEQKVVLETSYRHRMKIDMPRPRLNISDAGTAAIVAAVLKDDQLMKLAAETALAFAFSGSWTTSEGYWKEFYPGRKYASFGAAQNSFAMRDVMDLASGALNESGQQIILKAIVNKGLSQTLFSLWARPAGGNQGVFFNGGKMIYLLILEKYYADVAPYTEAAKAELDKSMDRVFFEDGGYGESTGYMNMTLSVSLRPYLTYANARKLPLDKVVPQNIRKSAAFGEIIYSTSKNPRRKLVAYGQSNSLDFASPGLAAYLALCCPDSIWRRLVPANLTELKKDGLPQYLFNWQIASLLPEKTDLPELKAFTDISSIGAANSYRKYAGEWMKILAIGIGPRRGKADLDCGSFIIEYAGDAFADDIPKIGDNIFHESSWHNLLIPTGTASPAGQSAKHFWQMYKNKISVVPKASGNEKSFKAVFERADKAWESKYFERWKRTIDSPEPETVLITDDYKLGAAASGVDFTWVTTLPAEINGSKIIIRGDYGAKCEITWSNGCTAKVERFTPNAKVCASMFLKAGRKFSRILIHREGKDGTIAVKARFIPPEKK